jgi:hypothetical protein
MRIEVDQKDLYKPLPPPSFSGRFKPFLGPSRRGGARISIGGKWTSSEKKTGIPQRGPASDKHRQAINRLDLKKIKMYFGLGKRNFLL